jgi:hypothetical protein
MYIFTPYVSSLKLNDAFRRNLVLQFCIKHLWTNLMMFLYRPNINLPTSFSSRNPPMCSRTINEGVYKSFRTGRLERELHMVKFSAIRCSGIAIVWVSLVSFAAIVFCVASQRVFIIIVVVVVVVYFVIDSVRKLLDTTSYRLPDFKHL